MMKHVRSLTLSCAAALALSLSSAAARAQTSELYFDVVLRGTGSATLHAEVYENPEGKGDATVLAVHGLTERGSMYAPLAGAIYSDAVLRNKIARIVAIDLVAHGLSSAPTLPSPLLFGDLLIEDNVGVVIQSIGYLNAIGLAPSILIGHSMGSLAIQAAQEALLVQGSSLRQLGIKKVALMAAVPARGADWTRLPGGDLSPFIVVDPVLGTILDLPAAACGSTGGFTTLSGTQVPGAPSAATCIANDWVGPEPITAVVELVGTYCFGDPDSGSAVGLCRPFVRQSAFKAQNGTTLTVLAFSQDVLTPFVDQAALYTYLTGKSSEGSDSAFEPVVASDAVHSMFISSPAVVAERLRKVAQ